MADHQTAEDFAENEIRFDVKHGTQDITVAPDEQVQVTRDVNQFIVTYTGQSTDNSPLTVRWSGEIVNGDE